MKKIMKFGFFLIASCCFFSSCKKVVTSSNDVEDLNYYLKKNRNEATTFTWNAGFGNVLQCKPQIMEYGSIKLNWDYIDDTFTIYDSTSQFNEEYFSSLSERVMWSKQNSGAITCGIVFMPVNIKKKTYKVLDFENLETVNHYSERKQNEYLHSLDGSQFITIPEADNLEVGLTLVTQKLFKSVLPDFNLYREHDKDIYYEKIDDDRFPVQGLSYLTAIYFCNKFSKMSGLESVYSICGEFDEDKWGYRPFVYERGQNRKFYVTNQYYEDGVYNIFPDILMEKVKREDKRLKAGNKVGYSRNDLALQYIKVDYSKNGYRLLTKRESETLGDVFSLGDLNIKDVEYQNGEKSINNYSEKINKFERFEKWGWDENGNVIPKCRRYVDSQKLDGIDVMPVATKKANKYGLYDAGTNCGFLLCWTDIVYSNTFGLVNAYLAYPNSSAKFSPNATNSDDITRVESLATIRLAKNSNGKPWK